MKMKSIAICIALVTLSSSAFAEGYVGLGVGQGKMSFPSISTTYLGYPITGAGDKTTDTSYKLYGGYNFTQNWGVEVGYNDFGNGYSVKGTISGTPYTISDMKGHSWYVAGTGTLPLQNGFSLFAKLGVAENHTDGGSACVSGNCGSVGSENHSSVLYGVGASYNFTKQWAARLEYEDFGKVTSDDVWGTGGSGAVKASAWTLSAKYSF